MSARLSQGDAAPLAVAFSGGGDSLALLLIANTWAERNGRRLLTMTVDHQLRPEGATWAALCADRAKRLGVPHRTLVWDGPKPAASLSAAARHARHTLLADAAREAGARVILMGHTADDRIEAALMRETGSTTPSPRVWSPSPVWPQGRDLFLMRPLLDQRRRAIRAWLSGRGEVWIEDPANVNPASPRVQARGRVETDQSPLLSSAEPTEAPAVLASIVEGPAGDLSLPIQGLLDAPEPARVLGAVVVCVSGASRPPPRPALDRLIARLASDACGAATLGRTKIKFGDGMIQCVLDAARRGGGLCEEACAPAATWTLWDGRFAIWTEASAASIGNLAGHTARLSPDTRRALAAVPALARPSAPLIITDDGQAFCPTLVPSSRYQARSLVLGRLKAALGVIVNEATVPRMAEWPAAS